MRTHLFKQAPAVIGGHHADDDVGVQQSLAQIIADAHAGGNQFPRKEQLIDAAGFYRLSYFFFMRPQADAMISVSSSHDRQRRSPGSRSDDGNLAHLRFDRNLFSVPAASRRRLGRCFQIISSEEAPMNPSMDGVW